jgi:hypothetical protein
MRLAPQACATGLVLLSVLALTGCGKHYWGKVGAGPEDFARDSGECARESALYRGATKEFGTVLQDQYKNCLKSRGWQRGQKLDPPPPGWYRGIEGDETVRFSGPRGAARGSCVLPLDRRSP